MSRARAVTMRSGSALVGLTLCSCPAIVLCLVARACQALINHYWRAHQGHAAAPAEDENWVQAEPVWETLTEPQQQALTEIAEQLSALTESWTKTGFSVKLSTQSPKDNLVTSHRKAKLRELDFVAPSAGLASKIFIEIKPKTN